MRSRLLLLAGCCGSAAATYPVYTAQLRPLDGEGKPTMCRKDPDTGVVEARNSGAGDVLMPYNKEKWESLPIVQCPETGFVAIFVTPGGISGTGSVSGLEKNLQ